ncbi:uncharacterized protein FA14DRAFT_148207 [Meira miltonrushii]|uniref:THIF-type NAD/FAD binding fold domain-containing protein n=1 Tax=Meira miltonrushii TaxID=1280837 RepID=A0A316V9V1_9BASI|nr:uncharacterized protein FA14DRAFT_148207 [Meira miltonrushii]PWN34044.1 hypothetical protein FA14DRAFT_148207 [Meira miltonrushii]
MVVPSSEPSWTRSWTTFTAGVAVASSAITLISILGFQRFNRQRRRHELEDDIKDAMRKARNSSDNNDEQAKSLDRKSTKPHEAFRYDESLIREQLSRNYSFLGEESMQKLRDSFVIVVGAGGVGSWCALMLLRSGVGRLRLIDFDQVSLSSLNRHACANLADVGRPKVQVCKEHFANIAPWCDVDARVEIFRGSEAKRLLGPAKADPSKKLPQMQPTYVVDCIDNMDTKVDLLAFCYHNKIPCFSSMGAGAKADPSQIQVADLNTTSEDPLARRVRRGLRAKGIWGGDAEQAAKEADRAEQMSEKPYTIMCVYTNEKSDMRLLPLDEEEFQKGSVDELAALEDFRVRILPVLGPLPAMFGLAAATFIICEISGRQLETLPWKARRKTAERTWHELENTERKYPSPGSKLTAAEQGFGPRRIPWTAEDVAYVFEEVYRCRSVVPPHETLALGRLLRWDSTLPLSYSNVALFSREQGAVHEREVLKNGRSPVEVWGEEATRMFKRRMADERRMNVLR